MAALYFLFPAILVPVLIINTKCHTANNSDVIVINSGHADAIDQPQILNEPKTTQTTENIKIMTPEITTEAETEATEDVVFVPNEKELQRNFDEDKMRIGDVLYKKTVGDVINDGNVRIETEAPNEDIVFISGKNNENVELSKVERRKETNIQQKDNPKKKIRIDCSNLDCNNTVRSVCGVKKDNGHLKYRLFLNDCYFRKVNCNFQYQENRYKRIELERCSNIGSHNTEKPFSFNPMPLPLPKPGPIENFRRISSSRRITSAVEYHTVLCNSRSWMVLLLAMGGRSAYHQAYGMYVSSFNAIKNPTTSSSTSRSLSMGIDGRFCSHTCPISCPEDYDPECAVSGSGQRRVFVNHCAMDLNSCFYKVVWHRRPLSECVGGKKADMRQNRGFINWMQRVGIVDKNGRLVLT